MKRRNFLAAMLGAATAPAIVRAESLMKIVAPKQKIILPMKLHNQNGISGAFISPERERMFVSQMRQCVLVEHYRGQYKPRVFDPYRPGAMKHLS
jgi:hypothetical protein